jgi:hypothetical protein
MATNKVVTVTNASVVTNDTLEGYNFYSDQEGATPLNGGTVVTPANAAAGQTYALTDGVVHSVTAKPVGTTNGEFTAVVSNAVTVDLAASSFAVRTIATNGEYMTRFAATPTVGYYVSFSGTWSEVGTNEYILSNDGSLTANGSFGLLKNASNEFRVFVVVSGSTVYSSDLTSNFAVDGTEFEIEFVSLSSLAIKMGGTTIETMDITGFAPANKTLVFGALNDAGATFPASCTFIAPISIDGQTWDLAEQTGSIAIGQPSGTNQLVLVSTSGNIEDMWVTV